MESYREREKDTGYEKYSEILSVLRRVKVTNNMTVKERVTMTERERTRVKESFDH